MAISANTCQPVVSPIITYSRELPLPHLPRSQAIPIHAILTPLPHLRYRTISTDHPSPSFRPSFFISFFPNPGTPVIGTEFERGVQLSAFLGAANSNELNQDLAILDNQLLIMSDY